MDSCCSDEPVAIASRARNWGPRSTTACAIALALVPKCPACWSVYAGLSSWFGLSIAMETAILLPLTCASLGAAVGFLGWQARRGRGAGPLVLGAVAAALVIFGKFVVFEDAAVYVGLGALLSASLWSRHRLPARVVLAEGGLRTAP